MEEIAGEPFRFFVRSFSKPETKYLVDISEHDWRGQCGCNNWHMKIGPKVKAGERVYCKHVRIARQVALDTVGRLLQKELNKPRSHQR